MTDPLEQREGGTGQKYSISSYRDGGYQPNGQFTPDRLLSESAISTWEDENRRAQGKAWGWGQALFLKNEPVIFGRQPDLVDVKIDGDPDKNGNSRPELGVSRRHFQLQTLSDTQILITDLGSTNGVTVYSKEGKVKATLNGTNPKTHLEIGDFTLLGGGGSEEIGVEGRLIGFSVCQDNEKGMFLVKFNAKNIDDLLALTGRVRQQDITASKPAIQTNPELYSALDSGLRVLVNKMIEVRELAGNTLDPKFLIAQGELIADIISVSQDLGLRFFNNDPGLAATRLGFLAMGKGEESLKQGDKKSAARSLELSLFINNLISGRLIEKVDDQ